MSKHDAYVIPKMDLSPMVDVVFLLLIFFAVASQPRLIEKRFDLPQSNSSTKEPETPPTPTEKVRLLLSPTQINFNNIIVTRAELQQRLAHIRESVGEVPVILSATEATPFERVLQTVDSCVKVGMANISLGAPR